MMRATTIGVRVWARLAASGQRYLLFRYDIFPCGTIGAIHAGVRSHKCWSHVRGGIQRRAFEGPHLLHAVARVGMCACVRPRARVCVCFAPSRAHVCASGV